MLQRSVSGSALGDLSHLSLPVVCNQVVPDSQLPLANQRGVGPRGGGREEAVLISTVETALMLKLFDIS